MIGQEQEEEELTPAELLDERLHLGDEAPATQTAHSLTSSGLFKVKA